MIAAACLPEVWRCPPGALRVLGGEAERTAVDDQAIGPGGNPGRIAILDPP